MGKGETRGRITTKRWMCVHTFVCVQFVIQPCQIAAGRRTFSVVVVTTPPPPPSCIPASTWRVAPEKVKEEEEKGGRDVTGCFMSNWSPPCSLPETNHIHSSRHLLSSRLKKHIHTHTLGLYCLLWATFQPHCSAVRPQSKQESALLWSERNTIFEYSGWWWGHTEALCQTLRAGEAKNIQNKSRAWQQEKKVCSGIVWSSACCVCSRFRSLLQRASNSAPEGYSTPACQHRILISAT